MHMLHTACENSNYYTPTTKQLLYMVVFVCSFVRLSLQSHSGSLAAQQQPPWVPLCFLPWEPSPLPVKFMVAAEACLLVVS